MKDANELLDKVNIVDFCPEPEPAQHQVSNFVLSLENLKSRFDGALRSFSEFINHVPSLEWQINEILPARSLCVLYGASAVGKTFVALDIALSIATGRQWLGRDTRQGVVLYIAAEGEQSVLARIGAWYHWHQLKPDIHVLLTNPLLMEQLHQQALIDVLKERDVHPALIVIDTFSRCMTGDENNARDMAKFIAGCDQLQKVTGATLLVIHHTGKDAYSERGSSVLRASADTMISVRRNRKNGVTLRCEKMRCHKSFPDVNLSFQEANDSLVLLCTEEASIERATTDELPDELFENQKRILSSISKHDGVDWRTLREETGLSDSTLHRNLKKLIDRNKIRKQGSFYFSTS